MHDRRSRLVWLGLILAVPPLIEAMAPATAGTWATSVGRVALVELLVVGGLVFAARHRRRMRAVWCEDVPQIGVEAARAIPFVVAPAPPRRRVARVRVPAASVPPARPAIS